MKAPDSQPQPRHFGDHNADHFPHNLLPQESKRTLVTLTAPGKPEYHYNLTDGQLRLLKKLQDEGLVCPGFAATIYDMACFQSL